MCEQHGNNIEPATDWVLFERFTAKPALYDESIVGGVVFDFGRTMTPASNRLDRAALTSLGRHSSRTRRLLDSR